MARGKQTKGTLLAVGALSAIVGVGLYADYQRKKEEADAANAAYQEALGKSILAKAQGDQQQALGQQILAEAIAGSDQETQGRKILLDSEKQYAAQQEAEGRAIQLKAVADYKKQEAQKLANDISAAALAKGVIVNQDTLDAQVAKDKIKRNLLVGSFVLALAGGLVYWRSK